MSANDPFSVVPFKVPEQFRAFAEMGVFQAQDGYQKLKDAAVSNNGALEAMVTSATKGAGDLTSKVIGMAQTNTEAAFAFTQSLMGVKSLPEAFELMNAHARKQFDILSAQTQDLATLTHKVAAEAVEPIASGAAKAFKPGL
jgi:phasin